MVDTGVRYLDPNVHVIALRLADAVDEAEILTVGPVVFQDGGAHGFREHVRPPKFDHVVVAPENALQPATRIAAGAGRGVIGRDVVDVEADLRRPVFVQRGDVDRAFFAVRQQTAGIRIRHFQDEGVLEDVKPGLVLAFGGQRATFVRAVHVERLGAPEVFEQLAVLHAEVRTEQPYAK